MNNIEDIKIAVKKQFVKEWEVEHDNKGYYNWTGTDERIIELAVELGYNWGKAEAQPKKK